MARIFPFSEATSIAFKSMVILASSQRPVSIKNMSLAIKCSPHHVGKVLQRLAMRNLIFSKPGPKGGFSINKNIHRISLFDIYESVEGTRRLYNIKDSNIKDKRNLTTELHTIDMLSEEISNHFIEFLKSHSLAMYAKKKLIPEYQEG